VNYLELVSLVRGRTSVSYQNFEINDQNQALTTREKAWTEALAVGCHQFVQAVKERLGVRATFRSIKENSSGTSCILQEQIAAYNPHFRHEMVDLSIENSLPWNCFPDM